MQRHIIPAKQTDDVIITTSNILQEINYQKLHLLSFPSPKDIIHQPSTYHSQQYINYHCRKTYFTVVFLCLYNSTLSFLHKATGHKPVFKQRIAMCMHIWSHGHQMMVIQTTKTTSSFITQFHIH